MSVSFTWDDVERPTVELPPYCPCGGPTALPADAENDGDVVRTATPETVRRIHKDDCEVGLQEVVEELPKYEPATDQRLARYVIEMSRAHNREARRRALRILRRRGKGYTK